MINKDWIIRRANLTDIDALEQCVKEAAAETDRINFRQEIMEHPVWIAEYNSQLIACLVIHLTKTAVHVVYVMVSPNFRDQGLGRSLMTFAENEARKRKCAAVVVSLDHQHMNYLSLYEHLGWEKKSSEHGLVIMKKDIEDLATATEVI